MDLDDLTPSIVGDALAAMVRHAQAVRRLDPAALWSSLVVAVMLVIAGTGGDRYASLVVDGGACGPQRGLADPIVVTAQQQVNRVRTAGGRR